MYDMFGDDEWSDSAQVCLNGHPINSTVNARPDLNRKFCARCGQQTILECLNCHAAIRGYSGSQALGIAYAIGYEPPAYCDACGAPFPWTEARIKAAKDLAAELEGLADHERALLAASIDDLVRDTPRTQLAATRFKKLLAKVKERGGAVLWDMVKGLASEAAKKILLPGS